MINGDGGHIVPYDYASTMRVTLRYFDILDNHNTSGQKGRVPSVVPVLSFSDDQYINLLFEKELNAGILFQSVDRSSVGSGEFEVSL